MWMSSAGRNYALYRMDFPPSFILTESDVGVVKIHKNREDGLSGAGIIDDLFRKVDILSLGQLAFRCSCLICVLEQEDEAVNRLQVRERRLRDKSSFHLISSQIDWNGKPWECSRIVIGKGGMRTHGI